MAVYLIKPLEKKSIQWCVEMYRQNADGSISWFNMHETYRWGQGFVDEDMDCNLPYEGADVAYAKTDIGWGAEFEDSIHIGWEFSEDISEEEQEHIKKCYLKGDPNDDNVPDIGGAAWLFDGTHDWGVEDDYVVVYAPYKISLCDEDGTVIKETVKLRPRPTMKEIEDSMPEWLFAPRDSTQGG